MEDGPLLRSGCQNAGKAHGLCHNLIFRNKRIDLEKIHAESVTVACDRGLAHESQPASKSFAFGSVV